jgi:hypothetical protein
MDAYTVNDYFIIDQFTDQVAMVIDLNQDFNKASDSEMIYLIATLNMFINCVENFEFAMTINKELNNTVQKITTAAMFRSLNFHDDKKLGKKVVDVLTDVYDTVEEYNKAQLHNED